MENKGSIEEQLELFDSDTMEKLNPDGEQEQNQNPPSSNPLLQAKSLEIIDDPQGPAPYIHFNWPVLKADSISSGNIMLHWALVHKEISIKSAAELLVKHLSNFLALLSRDPEPSKEELNHVLAQSLGDYIALHGCLANVMPRAELDGAMWDILMGIKPAD